MGRWVPTGCLSLDRALDGGLQPGGLTLVYGEAETGKTTLAIQCSVSAARMKYKTLFVDTDGTFSPERLMQIALQDYEEALQSIMIFTPATFEEQSNLIDDLEKFVNKDLGLIVFDTITSLYRAGIVGREEAFKANRELNRQIAALAHIAKKFQIPILITSQVRSVLTETDAYIEPVASRVLRYWSSSVIGLFRTSKHNVVRAIIERSMGVEKKIALYLLISEGGISEYRLSPLADGKWS
ncbi:MAG: AAA family ATPase [Candidatus Bathyarchaeia archaeon]|nr:AAA family ATPase [Candidatus Bathyarchaeota archaeon]